MKKDSLKLQAYQMIKQKIITCEFAPSTLLNEELLREQINMSRTPIRDALSRLEQEGLLVILPKKGIVVSGLSVNEINMIFEVRQLVEPYALKNYGCLLSDETYINDYKRLTEQTQTFSEQEFYEMDDEFHHAIVHAVPNHFLHQTYDGIHTQNLRFRVMTGKVRDARISETAEEHRCIIKACLKKDWTLAAAELSRHLTLSKDATFDLLLSGANLSVSKSPG